MTSKIKVLGRMLTILRFIFDYFGGQKSRFIDFFKVVLELGRSRKCYSIVPGLRVPDYDCIFISKGCYMTSKI